MDDRRQRERRERRLAQWEAVADKRYAGCTLDNLERYHASQDLPFAAVRRFASDMPGHLERGESLVLHGPKGTGKDHLAAAVIRPAFMAGASARRVNGPDLQGMARDVFSDRELTEGSLVERYAAVQWLWLSDPVCPGGDLTTHQAAILYRILDRRYNAMLPTIMTINATDLADAERRVGPAIIDRVRHGATIVQCAWPSFRSREVAR